MIIPFAGMNMAHATQTTGDPYHIGKVVDGTYNETAALQRATQLMNIRQEKMDEKLVLDLKLSTITNAADVEVIKRKMDNIQGQIDQIMKEVNGIEVENMKFYYIEPTLLKKYNAAKDSFADFIVSKYWKGASSLEDKKNTFPLVELKVNGIKKAVEITLWKGIENSPKADQYVAIIKELMPKDIPWFVSYGDYAQPVSCTSRTGPNTCSPLVGGIEIGVDVNPSTQNGCTLGFKATRNSDNALGFVTAGHCENGLAGNTVTQALRVDGGSAIGTASTQVFSNGSDCDCGWVKLNAGITISDAIYLSSTSTYTPTSLTPQYSQTAGTLTQISGAASYIVTGSVTSNDVMLTYDGTGLTIYHLVTGTGMITHGDSGAPVTNISGTSLFGVLSAVNPNNANQNYWSPENRAATDLGVTIVVG